MGYSVICTGFTKTDNKKPLVIPLSTRLLDISGNNQTFLDISVSEELVQYLIHLNISSCGIRVLSGSMFNSMKNLIVLDLSSNYLPSLTSKMFASLGRLERLVLKNNKALMTISSEAFVGLTAIGHLSLTHLKIGRIEKSAFASLKLDYLDLTQNEISVVEDNAFESLIADMVYLNKTQINEYYVDMFKGVDRLSLLVTDSFKFCCIKPYFLSNDQCLPHEDEISSCDDLLRNEIIRVLAWLVGMTAIISNIFAIIYRIRDAERMKLGYGIFVTNLAISDSFMGLYLIIIASADLYYRGNYIFNDDFWRHSWLCQVAGAAAMLSSEVSVLFVCFISLDRLLVVKFPFKNIRMTRGPSWVLAVIAWVIGLFLSVIPFIFKSYFRAEFYSRSAVCLALPLTRDRPAGWLYSVLILIGFNSITFILIVVGQLLIFNEVSTTSKKAMSKSKQSRKKELRVARNLFLVVLTDFLCWFPIMILGKMFVELTLVSPDNNVAVKPKTFLLRKAMIG